MIEKLKESVFNKSFILGIIFAIGLFSHYIFGNDNLYEQLSEKFIFNTTGYDIDFTPEVKK